MDVTSAYSAARIKVICVTTCNIKGMMCVCMCLSESHMYSHILVNNRRRKIGGGVLIVCVREALRICADMLEAISVL